MLLHDSAAANNVDLAMLGQGDRTVANDGQHRSPRRTSEHTRDVVRANRAALTIPELRLHSCFDASVGPDHSGREPPPAAAFTQGTPKPSTNVDVYPFTSRTVLPYAPLGNRARYERGYSGPVRSRSARLQDAGLIRGAGVTDGVARIQVLRGRVDWCRLWPASSRLFWVLGSPASHQ